MKRLSLLFLMLAATLAPAYAEPVPAKDLFTKNYDYKDFTSLTVASSFRVELRFAPTYEVYVEVPAYLEPYLRIMQVNSILRIDLEQLPTDIQKKLSKESDRLKARVSMPKLLALQASGAAHVSAHGQLNVGDEQIRIQLSGASELDDLKASGRQVSIQLSGASKGEIEGTFPEKVLLDLSGASKLRYKGNTDRLLIECSGASSLDTEGDAGQLTANVSGSSKCEIAGKANNLTMEGSGASKFELEGETNTAFVELSGVSKCQLAVRKKINYEISGVSTLKLKDLGAVAKGDVSRGSKIEYIR